VLLLARSTLLFFVYVLVYYAIRVQLLGRIDWDRVWAFLAKDGVRYVALVAAYPAGLLVFMFRERRQWEYGWIEILIGLAAVWSAVPVEPKAPTFPQALAMAGGIYIMVRGHDNRTKGKRKREAARAELPAYSSGGMTS